MTLLNNPEILGFYLLGAVAIFASLRTVTHANPVHAILSLIVSLLAVAGIFFVLGAPFAGMLEMIVYAGAILVLFVFVIMMLNLGQDIAEEKSWLTASAWAMPTCLALIVGAVLVGFIGNQYTAQEVKYLQDTTISAKQVGVRLFSFYVLLVEVSAFLLLGALVSAYHLGKKALDDENTSHTQEHLDNPSQNDKESAHAK